MTWVVELIFSNYYYYYYNYCCYYNNDNNNYYLYKYIKRRAETRKCATWHSP